MNPTHVDALVARGAALASTGQLRKAIDSFQAALQEDPDSVNARYFITINSLSCPMCLVTHCLHAGYLITFNSIHAGYLITFNSIQCPTLLSSVYCLHEQWFATVPL
jgi:tetratricopeptide (TPR) repeat protein